jgi:hypothetical protein
MSKESSNDKRLAETQRLVNFDVFPTCPFEKRVTSSISRKQGMIRLARSKQALRTTRPCVLGLSIFSAHATGAARHLHDFGDAPKEGP